MVTTSFAMHYLVMDTSVSDNPPLSSCPTLLPIKNGVIITPMRHYDSITTHNNCHSNTLLCTIHTYHDKVTRPNTP